MRGLPELVPSIELACPSELNYHSKIIVSIFLFASSFGIIHLRSGNVTSYN